MGRSRAAFYSRFLVSASLIAHHVIRIGGRRNLRDDPLGSQHGTRSPACSWLRQSRRRRYAVATFVVQRRVVAPDRKQDATQASRQGDHRDAPPTACREASRPTRATGHCRHDASGPTRPGSADSAAHAGRPSSCGRDGGARPSCLRAAPSPIAALTWPAWRKSFVAIDERAKRRRDDQTDAGHTPQPSDDGIARGPPLHSRIQRVNLRRQRRDLAAQRRQRLVRARRSPPVGHPCRSPSHNCLCRGDTPIGAAARSRLNARPLSAPAAAAPAASASSHAGRRRPMRARHTSRAIRLGQAVTSRVRFHLRRRSRLLRRVIHIGDDHLVARGLERLRHPFTLGPRLQQNSHRPEPVKRRRSSLGAVTIRISRRSMPLCINNPNLAIPHVQIDGTIDHGWLLL